jgi:hypothetical protein
MAVLFTVFALVAMLPAIGQTQDANASIRVMHASPDAPAVDVFVNGDAVLTNVPFFAISSRLSVPAGTYRVQVAPTGAGAAAAVIDGEVTVEGGMSYTVAAMGAVADIGAVIYEEDDSAPAAGEARVRIYHASPDAPAVDIKLAGTDVVILENVSFTDGAFLDVPAGTYQFDISPAGSSAVVFTTPAIRVESGWTYSLVASGFLVQPAENVPGFWVQSRVDIVR